MTFGSAITILKVSLPNVIYAVTLGRFLDYTGHMLNPEVSYTRNRVNCQLDAIM